MMGGEVYNSINGLYSNHPSKIKRMYNRNWNEYGYLKLVSPLITFTKYTFSEAARVEVLDDTVRVFCINDVLYNEYSEFTDIKHFDRFDGRYMVFQKDSPLMTQLGLDMLRLSTEISFECIKIPINKKTYQTITAFFSEYPDLIEHTRSTLCDEDLVNDILYLERKNKKYGGKIDIHCGYHGSNATEAYTVSNLRITSYTTDLLQDTSLKRSKVSGGVEYQVALRDLTDELVEIILNQVAFTKLDNEGKMPRLRFSFNLYDGCVGDNVTKLLNNL